MRKQHWEVYIIALLVCSQLVACQNSYPSDYASLSTPSGIAITISTSEVEEERDFVASSLHINEAPPSTHYSEPIHEQSAAEASNPQRRLPPDPEKQVGLPDPGFVLTDELGQEFYDRWVISMDQGINAPGALEEFFSEYPNFVYDRSGRSTSAEGDNPSEIWLILYKDVSPEEYLLNHERFAQFFQNLQRGIPDCIVLVRSGAPIDIFPFWFYVLTYDGVGDTYRQDMYAGPSSFEATRAGTMTETETQWILVDQEEATLYLPKYGYEPIPFSEVYGKCETKEQAREALIKFHTEKARQRLPKEITLPPFEITEWDSKQLSDLSPERQTHYDVFALTCYIQTEDRDYSFGNRYAIAKDFSHYYMIEDLGGCWLLRARPKSTP